MNRHRRLRGIAVLVAGALAGLGCSETRPAPARIGYLDISASLPLFIADRNGYFVDEGVAVEAVEVGTSNELVDAVVAGNLEVFVEASAVPVLAAQLEDPGRLKVFSVSSITREAPFDALLVRNDSPLQTLADLAGTRIGVFPGSTASSLLRKFLVDQGADVADIEFMPMPPQNHVMALLDDTVDAVHAYEPTIAIALDGGGVRRLYGSVYAEMLSPNPQGVAAISARFLEDDPTRARAVVRALERAMTFMNDDAAAARPVLADRLNLEPGVADRSVLLHMLPHDQLDASVLQRYADMLTSLGELSGTVDVNALLYRE